jgi:hypothetical protein
VLFNHHVQLDLLNFDHQASQSQWHPGLILPDVAGNQDVIGTAAFAAGIASIGLAASGPLPSSCSADTILHAPTKQLNPCDSAPGAGRHAWGLQVRSNNNNAGVTHALLYLHRTKR